MIIYVYTCIYIYIYNIQRKRERERERDQCYVIMPYESCGARPPAVPKGADRSGLGNGRLGHIGFFFCVYIYIYI